MPKYGILFRERTSRRCRRRDSFDENVFCHDGNGRFKTPGVSATQMDGWRSVYAYDYTLFTPESLTKIASDAGVHLYLDKPATVFAKEGFLAVHTKDGGEKTVRLPRAAACVTDLLTGDVVARDTDAFTTVFATPGTRLFGLSFGRTGK